jgi:hypothetical protein
MTIAAGLGEPLSVGLDDGAALVPVAAGPDGVESVAVEGAPDVALVDAAAELVAPLLAEVRG